MLASGSYFGTVVQGGYLVSMQLRTGNQGAIHWRKGAVAADNLPFFADGWMDGWMDAYCEISPILSPSRMVRVPCE